MRTQVIVLHCATADAAKVLLRAHAHSMLEVGYAWVGTEWASHSLPGELESELVRTPLGV